MQPSRAPLAALLLPLLLAAVAAVAAAAAVGAASALEQAPPPAPPLAPPTVFLHLSDMHYSINVHKYWRQFGDREGDAALFAQRLVPRLGLAGACITGDLTDSKTARGEGLQQEVEWAAYARLLTNLSAAGVPEAVIWDVPGNHDRFNMPLRGGAHDFFATHSAQGRRSTAALQPQPGQQEQQRVHVHQLPQAGGGEPRCPAAAWMLGLDPTPDPGLRSPTNFAGLACPKMLAEAHQALLGIQQQQPAGCGPPLVIAYCHYPLSTIDSSGAHLVGPPGILAHAAHSALAMQGLTKLLAYHNVSAVLSGHLHSSFGQRLHRIHATPWGGHMAEIETAAWKDDRRFRLVAVDGGALSFAELHFHTRNSPLMPGRSDAAAMQDPAWQAAYADRGWAVTALDPSAAVIEHIVLVSSPPDGRYSPMGPQPAQQQGASSQEGQDGSAGWVRALVFPLEAPAAGGDALAGLEVEVAGHLPGGVQLFSRPMHLQAAGGGSGGSKHSAGGSGSEGPLLFAGLGETTVSCVGSGGDPAARCQPPADHVLIQVSVTSRGSAGGSISRSPRQPVALRCAPLTASHQHCWVGPVVGEPLPLRVSLLEWMGLAFNWPVLVHRLFLCLWAFQVGFMLVLPRLLAGRVVPRIAASPLLQCHPEQQLAATPRGAAASSGVGAAAGAAARAVLGFLLWPVAALFICASVSEVWSAMLAYSVYLLLGPWLLYTALSGYPPALLFHFGVLGKLDTRGQPHAELAGWHFIGTPDTLFVSLVHSIFCLLPATLWVACVVARCVQLQPYASVSRSSSSESSSSVGERWRMEAATTPGTTPSCRRSSSSSLLLCSGQRGASTAAAGSRWSFSGWQLAALAGIAAFNWAVLYRRAWSMMGAASLLLSPGFAWTLPLALLLVSLWGSPRRAGGGQAAAKGE